MVIDKVHREDCPPPQRSQQLLHTGRPLCPLPLYNSRLASLEGTILLQRAKTAI